MSSNVTSSDPTRIDIAVDPLKQRLVGVTRLGNIPFDVPYITHIDGNLYQGGCANGLVLPTNIEHVISLYPWEQYTIQHQLKSYSLHWLSDTDESEPLPIIHDIAAWVIACLKDGPTLVHCQAGLNRSSLVAALVLLKLNHGSTPAMVIDFLRKTRAAAVLSNSAFQQWLLAQPVPA